MARKPEIKTVKEHLQEADTIKKHIDASNAMVLKLQSELSATRAGLEALIAMQHPALILTVPYALRTSNDEKLKPADLIKRQIDRINATLGDKV